MNTKRISYFLSCLGKSLSPKWRTCPNCGTRDYSVADKKYLVTKLLRCHGCKLLYRVPITTEHENEKFYNFGYEAGVTTNMPSEHELAALVRDNFAGVGQKEYRNYVGVLSALSVPAGASVFEFGCSWGYGSHQLKRAGYDVTAYEISESRRNFARDKLSIRVTDNFASYVADNAGTLDCFFSASVLEHVPSPSKIFMAARTLLKVGGLFVAFAPNGTNSFRNADFAHWHMFWGEVHPNFLDDQFYQHSFPRSPALISSNKYYSDQPFDCGKISKSSLTRPGLQAIGDLTRGELLFAARKIDDTANW